jgi:hypothetical protein
MIAEGGRASRFWQGFSKRLANQLEAGGGFDGISRF